ncbi:hypothetical protein [Acidisoma sp. S159]|uniref:hypothetical protein n=1 Tax=Acidisoma sp. S159 TaxID=1747225 RepID=UPI00131ABB5C|nr:hypothetical protein [Acidisoma sp. S159]
MSAKLSPDNRDARLAAAYHRIFNRDDLVPLFVEMIVNLSEIQEDTSDENEQAERMILQICTVLGLVVEKPSPLTVLVKTAVRLRDVREGRAVSPMFQRRKVAKGGPNSNSGVVHAIRGFAARACTCFAKSASKKPRVLMAAERVAKELQHARYKRVATLKDHKRAPITATTVKGWREKCMTGDGGGMSGTALNHYRDSLGEEFDALPLEQQGEKLIEAMRYLADTQLAEISP